MSDFTKAWSRSDAPQNDVAIPPWAVQLQHILDDQDRIDRGQSQNAPFDRSAQNVPNNQVGVPLDTTTKRTPDREDQIRPPMDLTPPGLSDRQTQLRPPMDIGPSAPNRQSAKPDSSADDRKSWSKQPWMHEDYKPAALDQFGQLTLHEHLPPGDAEPGAPSVVVVDLQHHRTHVLQLHHDQVEDVVNVPNAVGKEATPTPEMKSSVMNKRLDPIWTPPVSIDPLQTPFEPYSINQGNPLGVAYISLNTGLGAYGLHGTNRPDQIGTDVSHGCIRHYNQDIMRVFPLVQRGTPVYLTSHMEGLTITPYDFQLT